MNTFIQVAIHTLEVFVLGVLVIMFGGAIDALANYHPTGKEAAIWGYVGLAFTGVLKGIYSQLVSKQAEINASDIKKYVLFLFVGLTLTLGGCTALNTALDKVAPDQVDPVTNQAIPGTRTPIQPVKDAAGMIPYGGYILSALLLAANFYQRYEYNKSQKALNATVVAIEAAGKDPAQAGAVGIVKNQLAVAHEAAGVTQTIKDAIAKVG